MPPEDRFDRALSRRDLLRFGAAAGMATAGAVLLPSLTQAAFAATSGKTVAASFASDVYVSPSPQRFSLVLRRFANGDVKDLAGPAVDVRFKPPGGPWGAFSPLQLDTQGLPENKGIYRTATVFDEPGVWKGQAKIDGTVANTFPQPVSPEAVAPVPGDAAPRAASPTVKDALGVNPICTRVPACPLHTVSLSDVVGTGWPVAVLFATPALCQFAYCGPVLDEMLGIMGPYQDRVLFVHVDIYKNSTGTTLSPTVKAWGTPRQPGERRGLPSEPWLFGINGTGIITARLDTAFGSTEMVSLLDDLIAA